MSVPTLWTVFVINFLALGLIWAYVIRSYPAFGAARFWAGSAVVGAGGAAVAMLHFALDSPVPLLIGGTMLILAACLAAMGIKRFYGQPVSWRSLRCDHRIERCRHGVLRRTARQPADADPDLYSLGQSAPLALTLKLLLSRQDGRDNPGARLAGIVTIGIIGLYAVRTVATMLLHPSGDFSIFHSNPLQWVLVLALVFLSMALNFGFLLMAMDRLRNEVADLALLDDLTGVGNRRHLLQRLTEECARSERSGEPFALLVIDLDGFKGINDTHGHAAGDACLQHFTLMAQTRLRPGDMLARTGGDEFCIVLPSSTLREGAMIARRVIEARPEDAEGCVGADIPTAGPIGVAQWTRAMGAFPDRLIAAADHALYAAKNEGKNRHAVYDPAPPLVPGIAPGIGIETMPEQALRKHA